MSSLRAFVCSLALALAFTVALGPGCASGTPATRGEHEAGGKYRAVFDDLVAQIRAKHSFPKSYVDVVGHKWDDDLPALAAEWDAAKTDGDALVALRHLEDSLHDGHCDVELPGEHPAYLMLPVALWSGGTMSAPDVRIDAVYEKAGGDVDKLHPGDRVVAVDGLPIAAWFAAHRFESHMLNADAIVADTASSIGAALLPFSAVSDGQQRVLTVEHDGARVDAKLAFRGDLFSTTPSADIDHPPAMKDVACAPSDVDYGDGYALSTIGNNVCIYRSPSFAKVPIVRWVSFLYEGADPFQSLRMAKVDHDLLARELAGATAVVVDVHENGGGSNPHLFLRWLTNASVPSEHLITRVVAGVDEQTLDDVMFGDDKLVHAYLDAQRAHRETIESGFLCGDDEACRAAAVTDVDERVTKAPVAIITGPMCGSSCDSLSTAWSTQKLGPIVGKQPLHMFTVFRLPIHVEALHGATMSVALSRSLLDGNELEGAPLRLDWTAPSTFETRRTWIKDAVVEARRLLAAGR